MNSRSSAYARAASISLLSCAWKLKRRGIYSHFTQGQNVSRLSRNIHLINNKDSRDDKNLKRIESLGNVVKYLYPKDHNVRRKVIFSMAFLGCAKLISLCVPWFFKLIVDDATAFSLPSSSLSVYTVSIICGYGSARLGAIVLQELRNAAFAYVSQRSIRISSLGLFRHIQDLEYDFYKRISTASLIKTVDRGTKGVGQVLISVFFHLVPTFLEVVFVCTLFGTKLGAPYALVTIATIMFYSLFTFYVTSKRIQYRKAMNLADNRVASLASDTLSNIEAVKHFSGEEYQLKKLEKHLVDYEKASIMTIKSLSFLNMGQGIITSAAITLVMFLSRSDIASGLLTPGDLVLANGLLMQLCIPLNSLGSSYRDAKQSLLDVSSMNSLLKIKPKDYEKPNCKPLIVTKGDIKFENVSFSYSKDKEVISNISFEIKGGKRAAFIGPSGCGKSTIMRLISGTLQQTSGNIYIDGQNLREVSQKSVYKNIGIVTQEILLFDDTIESNIAYGNPNATKSEIERVARMAKIHTLISTLRDGYQTRIGESGSLLSGGQRQRLQVARMFIKNSPIALFDEYTTALDAETEAQIMEATNEFLDAEPQKTAVFVSHKLLTVMNCDQIFLLSNGRISDFGTHTELLARNPTYAQIWSAQMVP